MREKDGKTPIYKKWWFWVILVFLIVCGVYATGGKNNGGNGGDTVQNSSATNITDYTNKDAKIAYEELQKSGYTVKFVLDRNTNGGFTSDGFQDFIEKEFSSDTYNNENGFTVTKQSVDEKIVTLGVEYTSVIKNQETRKAREEALEEKLGRTEAMTACMLYGERNYRNFKMHSIVGKIAEYASDDDTWFLKYTADADGYKNLTMECYVTGTSANPEITEFTIY